MAAGGPSIDFESPPVAIQTALSLARKRLGMDVAFVSEVTGARRIFRYVDSDLEEGPVRVGEVDPLDETYCKLVIDGSMPVSVGDVMNWAAGSADARALRDSRPCRCPARPERRHRLRDLLSDRADAD